MAKEFNDKSLVLKFRKFTGSRNRNEPIATKSLYGLLIGNNNKNKSSK